MSPVSKRDYHLVFDSSIQDYPCKVCVVDYEYVPASTKPASQVESDLDFYGYQSVEYEVLGENFEQVPWLMELITPEDEEEIEAECWAHIKKKAAE